MVGAGAGDGAAATTAATDTAATGDGEATTEGAADAAGDATAAVDPEKDAFDYIMELRQACLVKLPKFRMLRTQTLAELKVRPRTRRLPACTPRTGCACSRA